MKKLQHLFLSITVTLLISCGGGGSTYSPETNTGQEQDNSITPPDNSEVDNTETTNGNDDNVVIDKDLACQTLTNDPTVNWYDSGLTTDQDIVACLANSLGKPIGFGENATGGYDVNGASKLVVISKQNEKSVEQQVLDAVSS